MRQHPLIKTGGEFGVSTGNNTDVGLSPGVGMDIMRRSVSKEVGMA
jgi:hypothetical protein